MSSHYRAAPQGWEISPTPGYLLTGGPYRFSRNPMYVGEAAIWAGWAVLFGSLPVTAGLLAVTALQNGAVRLEERTLHKRWAAYDPAVAHVAGRISLLQESVGTLARLIVRLPLIGMSVKPRASHVHEELPTRQAAE
jgi:steroid 5-alpha reductase family enzyme